MTTFWNQRTASFVLSATLLLPVLSGCGGGPAATPEATVGPIVSAPLESPDRENVSPSPAPLLLPRATGERVEENKKAAVDCSHPEEGYIMARRGNTERKLKLRITKETEYIYDLTEEDWTAFPLSEGDGKYTVAVFEQVEDTTYLSVFAFTFEVELEPFAPFLRPNQQVDYANSPLTLAKAEELTAEADGQKEEIEKIYSFVSSALNYDDQWAKTVQSGYIPVLDQVLRKEGGICLDFAALMTAMVRSRAIPCRLVVGDAGSAYHAWVEVWEEDRSEWTRYDPTFTASGKDVSGVEYTPKFYY